MNTSQVFFYSYLLILISPQQRKKRKVPEKQLSCSFFMWVDMHVAHWKFHLDLINSHIYAFFASQVKQKWLILSASEAGK